MSEKEIIERLIGIIERLLDENERLRKQHIVQSIPTYPKPVTIPTTFPAPTITCDTGAPARRIDALERRIERVEGKLNHKGGKE